MRRKSKPEEAGKQQRKTVRSLSISQNAWDAIKDKAARERISASEFLERIGRDASVLETPIDSRIKAFLEARVSIWWSWSEATRRYALQLGIVGNHTESYLDEHTKNERLKEQKKIVGDCLWRSIVILALINYAIPEIIISSMTPVLRWMCFKMLVHQAEQKQTIISIEKKSSPAPVIAQEDIESDLLEIRATLDLLQQFSPSYYEVLDMMTKGKMSLAQIAKYKRLNTHKNITEAEVRKEAKEAIYQLRAYIHNEVTKIRQEDSVKKSFGLEGVLEAKIRKYYQLCSLPYLQEKDIKNLEENFLCPALDNAELEFWIREIDHLAGHRLGRFPSAHINPEYTDLHYELRQEIEDKFKNEDKQDKNSLRNQLSEMDKKLMFCKSFKDIRAIVEEFVNEISQGSLKFSTIPFPENFISRKE